MAGVSVSLGAGVVGARASARVERRASTVRGATASVNGGSRATAVGGSVGRSAFLHGAGAGGPAGLGSAALPRRRASRARTPVAPNALFSEFMQNLSGPALLDGWGLPNAVEAFKALPAITTETIADLAVGAVAIFGAGVFINDTDSTPEVATQTGGGGGQGGGGRFGGGGGDDYNDKWYFEDPESDANNFFIRGGVQGIWWIIACSAASAYCVLIGKAPHLGAFWGLAAVGIGWGLFVSIALGLTAVVVVVLAVDYFLQWSHGDLHAALKAGQERLTGGLIQREFDIQPAAADKKNVVSDPNKNLPEGVKILGTDAQMVQVDLKPGEEMSADPGAMCYMSANVRSITSMQGGVLAGISRVLAGEPFFLNSFKNIANDGREGYIALAGRREGDKIIVLDLERFGGEILCARDSYLCSKGQVSIDAATTFTRGQMGLRLFLSNQNTIFMQKLSGTGLACISGNGTVIRQDLEEGQEMVVDARAVCAFSKTIGYQLRLMSSPLAALFGGEGLFFARLSGPGTFYLQSLPAARQDGGLRDEGEVAV